MAGCLDPKQRIMDVIITNNGRRQIVDGTFSIKYASFSDHGMFYRDNGNGVADDAAARIMFEPFTANTDIIIPEINDTNSISMDTSSGKKIVNGQVYTSGSLATGTSNFISGAADVYSSSMDIIQTAVKHFDYLQIIGTDPGSEQQKYYTINPQSLSFEKPTEYTRTLDNLPPLYVDSKMASQPNFQYMAPCYTSNSDLIPMASYPQLQENSHSTIDTLTEYLYETGDHSSFSIESSDEIVNLLAQAFELDDGVVKKLTIVDYGAYYDETGGFLGQVYYLGKLYRDSNNIPKFVRILTLLFE